MEARPVQRTTHAKGWRVRPRWTRRGGIGTLTISTEIAISTEIVISNEIAISDERADADRGGRQRGL